MKFLDPSQTAPKGSAPGLKVKLLSDNGGVKSYILVFAIGDEILSGILEFAKKYHVACAHFTAIGALKKATSGWYDITKKSYLLHSIDEQVELVSLVGNIDLVDGKPAVHAHFSVGYPDGRVGGGHLVDAFVFPTCELFVTTYPTAINKHLHDDVGLNLIDL
jgi:predicted DNA-binding protein with PD1-like motif